MVELRGPTMRRAVGGRRAGARRRTALSRTSILCTRTARTTGSRHEMRQSESEQIVGNHGDGDEGELRTWPNRKREFLAPG